MSYLPNDLSSDVLVSLTRVQQNDAALDTAISGNLTQANLSAATQIPNSMLATSNVEDIITFEYGQVAAGAIIPAASATIPIAIIRIPGSGSYTIQGASYAFVAPTGAGTTGSVSINAGSIVASVFSSASTLVSSTLLPVVAANQSAAADFTINTATFSGPTVLALLSTVAGVTASIRLKITLRITRALQ